MITKHNLWLEWCLLVLVVALLEGCITTKTPIPKTDIVFEDRSPHSFGFINANGTDLEYIDLGISQTIPTMPIETIDGKYLIFHASMNPDGRGVGYLSTITTEGEKKRYEIFHGGDSAPVLVPDQIIIATTEGVTIVDSYGSLHLFDLPTETIVKTYYTTKPGVILGIGTNVMYDSKLYFARYYFQGYAEIVSLDTETRDEIIIQVEDSTEEEQLNSSLFYPSVSPNGKWVAYSVKHAIYIIDSAGQEKPKWITDVCMSCEQVPETRAGAISWPAAPSWSPDSQWIIYHRCKERCRSTDDYAIFKANIQTGEEIKFLDEGLNPYWRLAQGL